MKKRLKKFTSLVLTCLLIFSVSSAALAANEPVTPVIVISGMNAYPLLDENGENAFPVSDEQIKNSILKAVLPLAGSVLTNDWDIFAQYGTEPLHDLFEKISCDENGDSVYNITARSYPESVAHYKDKFSGSSVNEGSIVRGVAETIGWDNTYFYYYDWRMNPLDLVDDLDVMVQKAMKETGSSKVSLFALSFGGMIATSYMYKYGNDNLKKVVFASTAFNGTELVGRLLAGDPKTTINDVLNYLSTMTQDQDFVSSLIGVSASALEKYGIKGEEAVDNYIKTVYNALQYPLYSKIFMDTFAHFKGIWCLMPLEYYEAAKEYMPTTTTFSESFFENVDEYMYNVQGKNEELINKAQTEGVDVSIIGAYGYAGIPLTDGSQNRTDNLIDTYLMTGNCAVAPIGKTLDSMEYSKEGACTQHNHVSTDNVIDASVGMLPEKTWVIKNMTHVEYKYSQQSGKLAVWIVTSEEEVDVHSDSRFPQFVELDRESGDFTSLTYGVEIPNASADDQTDTKAAIWEVIKKILEFLMQLVGLEFVK